MGKGGGGGGVVEGQAAEHTYRRLARESLVNSTCFAAREGEGLEKERKQTRGKT